MTCTNTDVTNTVQAAPLAISCATSSGNPGGNSTTAPALLFESGFAGFGWHLLPNSPAIDTGDPGPLALGQSATDRDGNPRVLDGNFDCVARRDKGAYEVTGQSAPCPSPATPAVTPTQAPSTPPKKKCKKAKKRSAVAAKKCRKKR
jgi:hypothetical protein